MPWPLKIKKLIGMGFIVICCGGGGIPVAREGRAFAGVDAVIDKDLASAKLAEEAGLECVLGTAFGTGVTIAGKLHLAAAIRKAADALSQAVQKPAMLEEDDKQVEVLELIDLLAEQLRRSSVPSRHRWRLRPRR